MIKRVNIYTIGFLIICIISSLAIQMSKINGFQEGLKENQLADSVNTITTFAQTLSEAQKKVADASGNVATLTKQVQNTSAELSQAQQDANKAMFNLEQAKQSATIAATNAAQAKQSEVTARAAYNVLP